MILPTALFVLSVLTATSLSTPLPRTQLLSCLSGTGVRTLSPGKSGFSKAATAYNKRLSYKPAAIVYPQSDDDVSAVVKCASSAGVSVSARSGGHSYAAYGLGGANGFLVVDLSSLTSISFAEDGVTATIGTGNRLGDVASGIYDQQGRALPHGVCPYVGIGGHAAFGGFGFTSRQWGLTLDRMTGARLILANGTIVDVSNDQYPDLFWAVRGSAASFGIATSYTFATLPAPTTTSYYSYSFSGSSSGAANALLALQSFGAAADPKLGIEFVMGTDLTWTFTGSYAGSSDQLATAIHPLLSQLPTPDSQSVQELGWIAYLDAVASGNGALNTTTAPDSADTFYAKSAIVPSNALLSSTSANAFFSYLSSSGPSSNTNWFIEAALYGGESSAISSVASDATAYGNREGLLTFQLYASSSNYAPPYPQEGFTFVDGMVSALATDRSAALGDYPNYADDQLTDAQWHTGYYGGNYNRLLSIKQEVDPTGVFGYPQSIGK